MDSDRVTYLSDAIARVEGGHVGSISGSHLAGVFSKCAKGFEKEIRTYVNGLLSTCALNYEVDLRRTTKWPEFQKTTLGNLIAVLKKTNRIRPQFVAKLLPGAPPNFFGALQKVNGAWVRVKHGDDVNPAVLLACMKSMLDLTNSIHNKPTFK